MLTFGITSPVLAAAVFLSAVVEVGTSLMLMELYLRLSPRCAAGMRLLQQQQQLVPEETGASVRKAPTIFAASAGGGAGAGSAGDATQGRPSAGASVGSFCAESFSSSGPERCPDSCTYSTDGYGFGIGDLSSQLQVSVDRDRDRNRDRDSLGATGANDPSGPIPQQGSDIGRQSSERGFTLNSGTVLRSSSRSSFRRIEEGQTHTQRGTITRGSGTRTNDKNEDSAATLLDATGGLSEACEGVWRAPRSLAWAIGGTSACFWALMVFDMVGNSSPNDPLQVGL